MPESMQAVVRGSINDGGVGRTTLSRRLGFLSGPAPVAQLLGMTRLRELPCTPGAEGPVRALPLPGTAKSAGSVTWAASRLELAVIIYE